jgi:hypothetical protein
MKQDTRKVIKQVSRKQVATRSVFIAMDNKPTDDSYISAIEQLRFDLNTIPSRAWPGIINEFFVAHLSNICGFSYQDLLNIRGLFTERDIPISNLTEILTSALTPPPAAAPQEIQCDHTEY